MTPLLSLAYSCAILAAGVELKVKSLSILLPSTASGGSLHADSGKTAESPFSEEALVRFMAFIATAPAVLSSKSVATIRASLLLAIWGSLTVSTTVEAVAINFDLLPHDEVLTDDFVQYGVLFEPISWFGTTTTSESPLSAPTAKYADHPDVGLPASFGNILSPAPPSTPFMNQGEFRIRFVYPVNLTVARPVVSVEADFIDVEWFDTRMEAYDIYDVLIDAVDIPIGSDLGVQHHAVHGSGIASVIIRLGSLDQTSGATDGVVIDNLEFTIPEPASVILIVLSGFAALRRSVK